MIKELAQYLKDNKDRIVKTFRTNVVREKRGYSDYTWWWETVSADEVEVVDFDSLMQEIIEFEQEFKDKKLDK